MLLTHLRCLNPHFQGQGILWWHCISCPIHMLHPGWGEGGGHYRNLQNHHFRGQYDQFVNFHNGWPPKGYNVCMGLEIQCLQSIPQPWKHRCRQLKCVHGIILEQDIINFANFGNGRPLHPGCNIWIGQDIQCHQSIPWPWKRGFRHLKWVNSITSDGDMTKIVNFGNGRCWPRFDRERTIRFF